MQYQSEAIMKATSPDDMFRCLEAGGRLLRLDDQVWPTMYRCATIAKAELDQIKRVATIIGQGRVLRIGKDVVTMENGTYIPVPDSLYIDRTADGLAKLEPVPVFQGRHITLQAVRWCQQVFSAAFIAHIESTYNDDKFKNDSCPVVPHPNVPADYITGRIETFQNGLRWNAEAKTAPWVRSAGLDIFGGLLESVAKLSAIPTEFIKADIEDSCSKLEQLLDQFPEDEASRANQELERSRAS